MLLHEKYTTLGTIIMAILTIIGTIAALTYYLSVTQYDTKTGFLMLFGVYFSMVAFIYRYFNRRLNEDV